MAAISCYQPCRSHLAQPARCFDEDDRNLPTLSYRRRQFIERCYEVRGVRQRDPIAPEVSVKKTREELTKNAAQNAILNRRLNIESGWSKVEEVRKKFEGVAAAASATGNSFSRSFESPPRRRLADSLFASFKLPRKKENMAQPLSLMQHQQTKRKSAVELLAETKAFYVKSETVLDRKQELPLRVSSGLGQAIAAGGCHLVSSGVLHQDPCCNPYATTRSLVPSRRAISAGDGLQNTLRKLLEHSDSREDVYIPPSYLQHRVFPSPRLSGTSSSGTSSRHPRQLSYTSIGSSPEAMELPEPVTSVEQDQQCTDIGAISPPAQYAHSAHSRCTSRCTAPPRTDPQNINSHKSLPDLHTHTRCYHEHTNISGTDTVGRSPRRRRHSAHQRTASCSSKGTRSNHSSLLSSCEAFSEHPSPAEDNSYHYNRCGSSFARDSGGSSGHYTQRSAPPHAYHDNMMCVEWVCAPPAFQDGAPSPPPAPPPPRHSALVGIHLQARAPPPQFQDDPPPYEYRTHAKCPPARKECSNRRYHRHHETTELVNKVHYHETMLHRPRDDAQDYVNATQICAPEEMTSPLGTFKRQRCLRYKQRRPRPILRSKSDISDRYRRPELGSSSSPGASLTGSDEDRLSRFFESLGLDDHHYRDIVHDPDPDEPVFFSDCSTVDSNRPHDYTVQGPPQKPIVQRNVDPPSIVERNARIIKWLCNCKKVQLLLHQQ